MSITKRLKSIENRLKADSIWYKAKESLRYKMLMLTIMKKLWDNNDR